MIFYFTGTGNSWAAAKAVRRENELMIDMAECLKKRDFSFTIDETEPLGFVCPVYFGGLPSIVKLFLKHLELEGHPGYTYAILTCGGMACDAGGMLERTLAREGITLDAVYPVVMPDNYVLMYELDSKEKQAEILEKAMRDLAGIRKNIEEEDASVILEGRKGRLMTKFMYPMYVHGRKTRKFHVNDSCVGCGVCVKRCPYQAIELQDGKPVWVKERCAHCMSCMRCNAIQYGKKTEGRARYCNPEFKGQN